MQIEHTFYFRDMIQNLPVPNHPNLSLFAIDQQNFLKPAVFHPVLFLTGWSTSAGVNAWNIECLISASASAKPRRSGLIPKTAGTDYFLNPHRLSGKPDLYQAVSTYTAINGITYATITMTTAHVTTVLQILNSLSIFCLS